MKKLQTKYYFTDKSESITIKVNEDCEHLGYKPIYIKDGKCWRHPENAINYYKWVIRCIEELNKQINEHKLFTNYKRKIKFNPFLKL